MIWKLYNLLLKRDEITSTSRTILAPYWAEAIIIDRAVEDELIDYPSDDPE